MSGVNLTVNTQINVSESSRSINIKVNNQVVEQKNIAYVNDGYASPDSNLKTGRIPTSVNLVPEEPKVIEKPKDDEPIKVVQKLSSGTLIGGGALAVITSAGRAMMVSSGKPSVSGIGLGTSVGVGTALLNIHTSDKKINVAKNVTGGALLGGGSLGMAQSLAKSIRASEPQSASASGYLLGAAFVGGIALANSDVGNSEKAKIARNTASGAMIAGSTTGVLTGMAKTILTSELTPRGQRVEMFHSASPTIIALGASLGTGIALANTEVADKNLRLGKNALAGALITGGAIGIGSSLVTTLSKGAFSKPSLTAIGVAVAVGAGIGLASTDTSN